MPHMFLKLPFNKRKQSRFLNHFDNLQSYILEGNKIYFSLQRFKKNVWKVSRNLSLYQILFGALISMELQHGSAEEGYYPHELLLGYEVCQMKGTLIGVS